MVHPATWARGCLDPWSFLFKLPARSLESVAMFPMLQGMRSNTQPSGRETTNSSSRWDFLGWNPSPANVRIWICLFQTPKVENLNLLQNLAVKCLNIFLENALACYPAKKVSLISSKQSQQILVYVDLSWHKTWISQQQMLIRLLMKFERTMTARWLWTSHLFPKT